MISSFFLLLFVGIKCQVAQVHFVGAGKYCWKMLLFVWPVRDRFVLHAAKSVKVHMEWIRFCNILIIHPRSRVMANLSAFLS